MNFINTSILDALAWGLVQSVWQVALFAGILWIIGRSKITSTFKYAIANIIIFFCFGLFVNSVGSHYIAHFSSSEKIVENNDIPGYEKEESASIFTSSHLIISKKVSLYATKYFFDYKQILVLLWLSGFGLLIARYFIAYGISLRIRKKGIAEIPLAWKERVATLRKKLKISKRVVCKISNEITSPVTLGFLKPIILFPASFFTQLTPGEIEAIIIHELTHIKRWDYLLNAFQILVKCVFFFHPGIYFITRFIDREREFSIDDKVISIFQNKEHYISALGKLQINKFNHQNSFAMNAKSNKHSFLKRLNRMLIPSEKSRKSPILTGIIALSIILGGTSVIASSIDEMANGKKQMLNNLDKVSTTISIDTIPNKTRKRSAEDTEIKLEKQLIEKQLIEKLEKKTENLRELELEKMKLEAAIAEREQERVKQDITRRKEAYKKRTQVEAKREIEIKKKIEKMAIEKAEMREKLAVERELAAVALEKKLVEKERASSGRVENIDQFKIDLFKVLEKENLVGSIEEKVIITMDNKKYYLNGNLISREKSGLIQELFTAYKVSLMDGKKVIANSGVIDIGVGFHKDKSYNGTWSFRD